MELNKRLMIMVLVAIIGALFSAPNPAYSQEMPGWLVGKFTGTQTVTSRPSWPSAPIKIEIKENGVWELNLSGVPGPATVNGVVVSVKGDAAILKGKYTSGRNYSKEIEYKLFKKSDSIAGTIEASWITMEIEVDLRPVPKLPKEQTKIADAIVQAMFYECLDAHGIPDQDMGCSKIPQP